MKLLMIGMDGVQESTFRRGWTPFIESLIDKGSSLDLREDIVSRGWAEIFTGRHATETGTFYERPVLDGGYRWTDKCQLNNIPGLGTSIRPLWQALNEKGYRVGVMNVPTTNPAPEVDGFFVSGGGGGRTVQQSVAEEQCFPQSVKQTLDKMGYVVDERYGSLLTEKSLYKPRDFFGRLAEMSNKRAEGFAVLSAEFKIDFGFVVFRSTVMAETLLLPELYRRKQGEPHSENIVEAGKVFYQTFDERVRDLVEHFPDAEVLLVSDHSTSERTHSVNFNSFLLGLGYQKAAIGKSGLFFALKKLRNLLPSGLVKRVKTSQRTRNAVRGLTPFDPKSSQAFTVTSHQANHGIYINDKERFGGPVSPAEIAELCDRIISDFNRHPAAREHGLHARRPSVPEGQFLHCYPDIYVDLPEGYTPSTEERDFVSPFPWLQEPTDLRTLLRKGGRISVKGHYPLATSTASEWLAQPNDERPDLRVVYDHILKRLA